ncbi:hypothetical protein COV93_05415 [Candidatus Woesearchaeota archaeon CG11_big_fil_rev_8_21_14_0_20_43_8]|nr:MAG: hypothetical protein COV93_05415 [Candidatus Woesearchaeota archaeon CG11_big_fil_rev_8_21_14_0_20_43_8]PIO05199.1 MAG: hypothetical protein COT47_05795 [Candidatus Woesearchaeota archaeon CG08_land_8_20_14_0_20_43_7]
MKKLEMILKRFGRGLVAPLIAPSILESEKEDYRRMNVGLLDKQDNYFGHGAAMAGAALSAVGLFYVWRKNPVAKLLLPVALLKTNGLSATAAAMTDCDIDPRFLDSIIEETEGLMYIDLLGKEKKMSRRYRKRSVKIIFKELSKYDDMILDGYKALQDKDYGSAEEFFTKRAHGHGLLGLADKIIRESHGLLEKKPSESELDLYLSRPIKIFRMLGDQKGMKSVATVYSLGGHHASAMRLEDEIVPGPQSIADYVQPVWDYSIEEREDLMRDLIIGFMKS